MKRLVVLLMVALPLLSLAQREIEEGDKPKLKDRLYFGGGFGINSGTDAYGNSYFFISLSPIVGYMINPKFSVGTGINWQRTSYDTRPSIVLNQYGVSPFLRYNFDQLFAYAEYNYISTPTFNITNRRAYNRLLLGVGYSQRLGGSRGAINAMALYDVLYNQSDRAFASPWVFRVFFSF
jgi:long-subunit fatty acid transport protein